MVCRAVAVLALVCSSARAEPPKAPAPAKRPSVSAHIGGEAVMLAHGRLKAGGRPGHPVKTWVLELSVKPTTCADRHAPAPHLLVHYDGVQQKVRLTVWSTSEVSYPQPKATVTLKRAGKRATGTVEAPVVDGNGGSGTFDVVNCSPDVAVVPPAAP